MPSASEAWAADRKAKNATPGATKKPPTTAIRPSISRVDNARFTATPRATLASRSPCPMGADGPTDGPSHANLPSGLRHRRSEVLGDLVQEAFGRQPPLLVADQQRQVLGHEP